MHDMALVNDILTALTDAGAICQPFTSKEDIATTLSRGGFDVSRLDDDDLRFIFRMVASGARTD
jgi:hypothetical protein